MNTAVERVLKRIFIIEVVEYFDRNMR